MMFFRMCCPVLSRDSVKRIPFTSFVRKNSRCGQTRTIFARFCLTCSPMLLNLRQNSLRWSSALPFASMMARLLLTWCVFVSRMPGQAFHLLRLHYFLNLLCVCHVTFREIFQEQVLVFISVNNWLKQWVDVSRSRVQEYLVRVVASVSLYPIVHLLT